MNTEPTNDALSGAPNETTPPTISLPSRPDYEVLEFIGRGGYGEVFLARDKAGVYWAVKVVYRISFDHDRPFEREYEGITKFEPISRQSESQLQILHVGRRDEAGYFYYIMELADDISRARDIKPGEYSPHTLRSELERRQRIAPGECCHLLRTLTIALGNLHRNRLVHRDIKPANIVFVQGRPKLADLGLVTDADKSMTCAGTEGYSPPEGPGSAQADIYSLGMVLYEAMTGNSRWDFPRLPQNFEEWEDHKTALALNRIIGKACHANVRKRYQSTEGMERDLDGVILGAGQNSRSLHLFQKLDPRKKIVLAIAACLAAMLIAAVPLLTSAFRKSPSLSFVPSVPSPSHEAAINVAANDTSTGTSLPAAEPIPAPIAAREDISAASETDDDDDTNAVRTFQTQLAPYGRWMNLNGQMYWQPNAVTLGGDWRPYSDNGRWVYTDNGWTWDSDYEWGWAAFHYGRWLNDNVLGWIWHPGSVWAPAWVAWRGDDTHTGWAPLPPGTTFDTGLGLMFNDAPVKPDFDFGLGADDYCFIDITNFLNESYANFLVPPAQVVDMYHKTKVIRHAYGQHGWRLVNAGIAVDRIRQMTHQKIRPMKIIEVASSRETALAAALDAGDTLAMYRPKIHRPAPARKLIDDIIDGRSPSSAKPAHDKADGSVANILSRDHDMPEPAFAWRNDDRPPANESTARPAHPNTAPPTYRPSQALAMDQARAAQKKSADAEKQARQIAAQAERDRLEQMRQARARALQARPRPQPINAPAAPRARPR